MKKVIIGVLMAVIVMITCCGCGKIQWNSFTHDHTTVTVSGVNSNEKTVYEYVDGELQSVAHVTYMVSSESGAN